MDENALKRKREEDDEHGHCPEPDIEGVVLEQPWEDLKMTKKQAKKQKRESAVRQKKPGTEVTADDNAARDPLTQPNSDCTSIQKAKAEKQRAKRERKQARREADAARQRAKTERKQQAKALAEEAKVLESTVGPDDEDNEEQGQHEIDDVDVSDLVDETVEEGSEATATPSSSPQSPVFDISKDLSGVSSVSSLTGPIAAEEAKVEKPKEQPQKPKPDPEELKTRLQQRIDALRAARKADGLNGNPARNRQELMEGRRRKEEQRRAHKKELRQKTKEEGQRKQEELIARGSPLMSPSLRSPLHESPQPNNFSFGRVAFNDGQQMDANLTTVLDPKKQKGPQDPLTALKAAQNKHSRINSFDETKRADIETKDVWLNARKRAHGERVRDDESLLKKTLKRKEKAKKKSEKEWGERIEGVAKGQAMRQRKREDNLQKRKEEKGKKGGKKGKKDKKPKTKARPGFEGSFRAKSFAGGKGK